MKKRFLALLVAGITFGANSLSAKDCNTPMPAPKAETDTLSYITGQQVAHAIQDEIIPQMRLDYNIIVSTLEKLFATTNTTTVEGVRISPETINELARTYFNEALQQRIIQVQNNDTAQVFNATDKKIASALIGADFAYSMRKAPFKVDKKSMLKAMRDVKEGKEMLTAQQANNFTKNYYTVVIPTRNKKESEKWLTKIEHQKGVQKTETGLLYKIEARGDTTIKATNDKDIVKVIYTGTTRKGKVFDSNRWNDMPQERKETIRKHQPQQAGKDNPIEFPLNRVIKGWTEGMKLIGKGGKITLWIPSSLAYGEQGAGNDIAPNEALRFDIELLNVTPNNTNK